MGGFSRSILPPRKRDWKPNTMQVGLFLRTSDGSTVEMTCNDMTMRPTAKALAITLLHLLARDEKVDSTELSDKEIMDRIHSHRKGVL